jgi:hypothetical protein
MLHYAPYDDACGKWHVGIMCHVLVWHALVWHFVYLLYAMWQNARLHVCMCMCRGQVSCAIILWHMHHMQHAHTPHNVYYRKIIPR